jgi:hypothetical protein
LEIILVEELNPKIVGHERTPVEEGDQLHHRESAVSTGPERKTHYRRWELSTGRDIYIVKALLEVVLPEDESDDGKNAEDKEGNDIFGAYEFWA